MKAMGAVKALHAASLDHTTAIDSPLGVREIEKVKFPMLFPKCSVGENDSHRVFLPLRDFLHHLWD